MMKLKEIIQTWCLRMASVLLLSTMTFQTSASDNSSSTVSTRVAVGIPRFVLTNVTKEPGFYTIKAQCIDTETGYADFVLQNRGRVIYQWGVKTGNEAIKWTDSESAEIKLSTTVNNENTTIYLKVKDANGNVSTPIFVRIAGYDIYDIGLKLYSQSKWNAVYRHRI
jgi:hypothetical protein